VSTMDINEFRARYSSNRKTPFNIGRSPVRLTSPTDVEVLVSLSAFFKPKIMVEIGVFEGLTSKIILDESPWIEKYIGVDILPERLSSDYFLTWGGLKNYETGNPLVPVKCPGVSVNNDARFNMLLLDNENGLKREMISPADMIFIDANHTYAGVMRDTVIAEAALNGVGVLVWHDYEATWGVRNFITYRNTARDRVCIVTGESANICFEIMGERRRSNVV
jgi:hypothetical protein